VVKVGEAEMKQRKQYDLDYKCRIVTEYLAGKIPAEDIAKREELVRGQTYLEKEQSVR
jgi:hypothetical protein